MESVRKGLGDSGYLEARNLTIEYRWANEDDARLPMLADDLARRSVSLIITIGTTAAAQAAKAASATVPVVFVIGDDPIAAGLVTSLDQPGRQPHRNNALQPCARSQADRDFARDCSEGGGGRHAGEAGHSD